MKLATVSKWVHIVFTVGWLVMIPISYITGWANSVAWVTFLSLWALVVSHATAVAASRADQTAERHNGNGT